MNWDLTKLYDGFNAPAFLADTEKFERGIAEAKALVAGMQEGPDEAAQVHELVERFQALVSLAHKLISFVSMTLAADSNCEAALKPRMRLMSAANELEMLQSAALKYIGENPRMDALCKADPLLEEHRTYIEQAAEKVRHLIPENMEATVLKLRQSGSSAWSRLRDELFAGLMIDVTIDGETRKLPLSGVRALANDPRQEVRRIAYEAELGAYPRMETGMAACLNGIKGEAITVSQLKNYDSVLDWSLAEARMDRATLDALLEAMNASLEMFRRYFRIKAKLLGHEGALPFYDLFASVGESSRSYTLEEARELLQKVFSTYNTEISDMMGRAFDERWIDAFPREGKVGGAFCNSVHPIKQSYILTNYDGSLSSVSTLAHELGHAFHGQCLEETSVLLCDVPMPLAETASTFNELLLAEHLLEKADAQEAIAILDQQIGDGAQVIVDILSRYLFEYEAVERRKTSTPSARELCEIMIDAQKQTYGDGLDPEYLHPYMWACKPHYYDPDYHFYNFPYAFGQLFGNGLYELYQQKGEEFRPIYKQLLQASGSGTIREVCAAVGVDVTDVNFWMDSLKLYQRKIDQLEKLAEAR